MNTVAGKIIVLGCMPIIGGLVVLLVTYFGVRKARTFRDWPTVPGIIESSEIIQTTQARLNSYSRSRIAQSEPTFRKVPVWRIAVQYRYTIGGEERTGYEPTSRLFVEDISQLPQGPSERMKALFAQLRPEAAMAIHYNPQDPRESYVLFIEEPSAPHNVRVASLSFIIGGCILIAGLIYSSRSPRALPDSVKQQMETFLSGRRREKRQ